MDEVGTALIAIALVLSAVFIPTAFVSGITGQFYRQFAVTIATATMISAFVSLTLSPALAAILFKPHATDTPHRRPGIGAILMWPVRKLFNAFNIAFGALERGYGRLVRGLIRISGVMLLIYGGLIGLAVWLVMHTPTGFIPALDRGIVIVSLQLPAGSSLERTDAVMRRANEIILSTPGFAYTSGFTGRSGATFTNASNSAAMFCVLDDFEVRAKKGQTVQKLAADLRRRLGTDPGSAGAGVRAAAGARHRLGLRLLDATAGSRRRRVRRAFADRRRVHRRAEPDAGTEQRLHHVPDADAAALRRRRSHQGADAARCRWRTSSRRCGSTWARPTSTTSTCSAAPIASPRRPTAISASTPQNVARIKVRNADGQMVPLGSLVTFNEIAGPERVPRYNLFPTVEINGQGAPGVSSGQALDLVAEVGGAQCCRKASATSGPTCPTRKSAPAGPATTSSRCRCCSCSWRWPRSTRAGRCRCRSC